MVNFCDEPPSTAVVNFRRRSTYRDCMGEKWNRFVRTGIATYVIVYRKGTAERGEEKETLSSAKPLDGQGEKDVVGSTGENAVPQERG